MIIISNGVDSRGTREDHSVSTGFTVAHEYDLAIAHV
jgi:hypothetical protein